jgi:hypothetical protein
MYLYYFFLSALQAINFFYYLIAFLKHDIAAYTNYNIKNKNKKRVILLQYIKNVTTYCY